MIAAIYRKAVIASILVLTALAVWVSATPPAAVHADRCDAPWLRSLELDDGDVVLRVYPDDSAGCLPRLVELSYGTSPSANIRSLDVRFTNVRLKVDIRKFALGGRIFVKVRAINDDDDKSSWSNPLKIRIPSPPSEPLPTPRIYISPSEYTGRTDRLQARWTNGGEADKYEVQIFAEERERDVDRTREREKSYPIDASVAYYKVRVRGITDRSFSAWSEFAYSYRVNEPTATATPTPTQTPPTPPIPDSANPPSATKLAPTTERVALGVGESVEFSAVANDIDRDLTELFWYVDGVLVSHTRGNEFASSWGSGLTHTFWKPGQRSVGFAAVDSSGQVATAVWSVSVARTTDHFDDAFDDLIERGFGERLLQRIEEVSNDAGIQSDAREAARLLVLGALCGEFCAYFDVPGADEAWYFVGWAAAGTLIPVVEAVADGRDALACGAAKLANNGCGTDDLIINSLAAIPWYLIGAAAGPKGAVAGAAAGYGIDAAQVARKIDKIRERSPRKADEAVWLLFAGELKRLRELGFSQDRARTLVRDIFAGRAEPREPRRIVGILENLSRGGTRDMDFVDAFRRGDKTGTGVIAEIDAYKGLKAHYEDGARNNCPPFEFGVLGGSDGKPDFLIPGCARYYRADLFLEVYRKQTPSWDDFADRIVEQKAKQLKKTIADKTGYGVVVADVRASDLDSLSGKGSVSQRLDAKFAEALRKARNEHSDRPLKGIRVVYKEGNEDVALTYYWDEIAGAVFRKQRGSPWSWEFDFDNGDIVKQ